MMLSLFQGPTILVLDHGEKENDIILFFLFFHFPIFTFYFKKYVEITIQIDPYCLIIEDPYSCLKRKPYIVMRFQYLKKYK